MTLIIILYGKYGWLDSGIDYQVLEKNYFKSRIYMIYFHGNNWKLLNSDIQELRIKN